VIAFNKHIPEPHSTIPELPTMNTNEYLSPNEELFAAPNDPYWPPFETLAEIGPEAGLEV
jgi:hypothetical protein